MTAHTHTEFKPGCYRCDLSKDEYIAALEEQQAELEAERDTLRAIAADLVAWQDRDIKTHYEMQDLILRARTAIKETP